MRLFVVQLKDSSNGADDAPMAVRALLNYNKYIKILSGPWRKIFELGELNQIIF